MQHRLRALAVVLTLALVPALAGCATAPSSRLTDAAGGRVRIVASTSVYGDIAETIGERHVSVESIIDNPDRDPHEYQADGQNELSVSKAAIVIENGGGYDDFMGRMLKSAGNDKAIVLNAVTISGHTAAGGQLNEHVWYDFSTVQKVVQRVESAYVEADPAQAAAFHHNADQLRTKINGLEQRELALKKSYAGQPVSITEPVPLYLLDAIGLVDKTPAAFSESIEEGTDVSAGVLKQTLDLYSEHRVKLLAYNAQTSGPETERVIAAAKAAGIPVVAVTETLPANKDYVGWMSDNLDAVGAALGR